MGRCRASARIIPRCAEYFVSQAAAERLFGVVKTTVLRVSASKKLVATELVLKDHSIFSRKLFLK
jgi:hypothetical protein